MFVKTKTISDFYDLEGAFGLQKLPCLDPFARQPDVLKDPSSKIFELATCFFGWSRLTCSLYYGSSKLEIAALPSLC